jgi:hypothetical protein
MNASEIAQNQLEVREISPHEHHALECCAGMTAHAVRC